MLRKIEISEGSGEVAVRFMELYKRGEVFDAKRLPRLRLSAELEALTQDIAQAFGADLLKAVGEKESGLYTAEILHNALFLVQSRMAAMFMSVSTTPTLGCATRWAPSISVAATKRSRSRSQVRRSPPPD